MVTDYYLDFMGKMGILETQRIVGLFPTHARNVCMMDHQKVWRKFMMKSSMILFCSLCVIRLMDVSMIV